jgi:hypothetical protein
MSVARKLIIALLVLAVTLVAYGPMGAAAPGVAEMAAMPGSMADCPMNGESHDKDSKPKCTMDGGCVLRCASMPVFQVMLSFALFTPYAGLQVFYFDLTDPTSASAAPPFRPPRLSILA